MEAENIEIYKDIIYKSPIGFAHHKIILDDEGKPIDYLFVDANPAIEKFTGLKIEKSFESNLVKNVHSRKLKMISSIGFLFMVRLH